MTIDVITLSPVEARVWKLVGQHNTRSQIAVALGISVEHVIACLAKARRAVAMYAATDRMERHREEAETRRQADARVANDLMLGRRCRRCHLTLPCDHSAAPRSQ